MIERFKILIFPFLALYFAAASLFAAAGAAASPVATDIRTGVNGPSTRFVLELSDAVTYRHFVLPDPYRVVIDLSEIAWNIPDDAATRKKRGLINEMRFGLFKPGTSRIVLDVDGPVTVGKAALLPPQSGKPYRFFIDIKRSSHVDFQKSVEEGRRAQAPAVQEAAIVLKPPMARGAGKRVIAIDAGHGGVDPGAIGISGIYEKKIVLAVARKVRDRLEASGRFKVVMTRDRDVFLSLRERVRVARRAGSDLFISIHADSIAKRSIRGATVYTLSERSSDKEAAALAAKENKSDIIAGVDLGVQEDAVANILIDLAQRETMNLSANFAAELVPELAKRVRSTRNSHRFAGFRVLKAPDVPSVLVELGYLSNRQDEKMLRSAKGQDMLADAIAKAVMNYFPQVRS